jgi:hypothetical protein
LRKITFTFAIAASMFFMFSELAATQTSGNVFFGYSYYSTNISTIDRMNANGWEASYEGRILPYIGLVGDVSAHYGSENFPTVTCGVCTPTIFNANVSEENFIAGPRFGVPIGKFRPFAQVLFGGAHVNTNGNGSDTSFATAVGGGLDYRLLRIFAWRLQGDYIQTRFFSLTQNNGRISTGIVVRF